MRYAEVLQRAGDPDEAVLLLEATLEAYLRTVPELPGWLCGRLASLYRSVKRYDDEVRLLEQYSESQSSDETRTRFDARLSKARAIADRKRHFDTNVFASVRRVIHGRDGVAANKPTPQVYEGDFPVELGAGLRAGLQVAALTASPHALEQSLIALSSLAHEQEISPERIIVYVKGVWSSTTRPDAVNSDDWESVYRLALTRSLKRYFGDP